MRLWWKVAKLFGWRQCPMCGLGYTREGGEKFCVELPPDICFVARLWIDVCDRTRCQGEVLLLNAVAFSKWMRSNPGRTAQEFRAS